MDNNFRDTAFYRAIRTAREVIASHPSPDPATKISGALFAISAHGLDYASLRQIGFMLNDETGNKVHLTTIEGWARKHATQPKPQVALRHIRRRRRPTDGRPEYIK